MKRLAIALLVLAAGCGGSGGDTSVTVNQNQTFNTAFDCFQFCGESEACAQHYGCADLPDEPAQSN